MPDPTVKDSTELSSPLASQEAGVADALELYMRVEQIYVKASMSLQNLQTTRTSNSTNSG